MRIPRLGRTGLYCYSGITVGIGCILSSKWAEMEVELDKKKPVSGLFRPFTNNALVQFHVEMLEFGI